MTKPNGTMVVRTGVKAGLAPINHAQAGIVVRTGVKGGLLANNHAPSLLACPPSSTSASLR